MIKGKVWKFGSHVDTDIIIPAKYLSTFDPKELAKHAMEGLDPEFSQKARVGEVMVAGENFGCGSSREHAPIALKALGISAIIAHSFARIFYRNAVNIGLPILECPKASEQIKPGDEVEVDLESGKIKDLTTGKVYQAEPFPEFMRKIIKAGGLILYIKEGIK